MYRPIRPPSPYFLYFLLRLVNSGLLMKRVISRFDYVSKSTANKKIIIGHLYRTMPESKSSSQFSYFPLLLLPFHIYIYRAQKSKRYRQSMLTEWEQIFWGIRGEKMGKKYFKKLICIVGWTWIENNFQGTRTRKGWKKYILCVLLSVLGRYERENCLFTNSIGIS
jgi:hypothetical protein